MSAQAASSTSAKLSHVQVPGRVAVTRTLHVEPPSQKPWTFLSKPPGPRRRTPASTSMYGLA